VTAGWSLVVRERRPAAQARKLEVSKRKRRWVPAPQNLDERDRWAHRRCAPYAEAEPQLLRSLRRCSLPYPCGVISSRSPARAAAARHDVEPAQHSGGRRLDPDRLPCSSHWRAATRCSGPASSRPTAWRR